MFESIWEDIKWKYKSGNTLIRIIMVNVAVFVFINLGVLLIKGIFSPEASRTFLEFFMISKSLLHDLTHPWVFITHFFLHQDFWHIFWNMVLLYMFGNIVGDLLSDKIVLPTYILSGLFGGLIYVLVGNIPSPWDLAGFALGASAAVNGFMMLSASKFPNYVVNLILIGPVKIKYIVGFFILIDVFALGGSYNSGGHLAHLGGAFMGWYIIYLLENKNIDLIGQTNKIINKVEKIWTNMFNARPKSKMKVSYKKTQADSRKDSQQAPPRPNRKADKTMGYQEKLDTILDKIKVSGYENLTEEEKEFLYKASKK